MSNIVERLSNGVVCTGYRPDNMSWVSLSRGDLEATNAIMTEAAAEIERLMLVVVRLSATVNGHAVELHHLRSLIAEYADAYKEPDDTYGAVARFDTACDALIKEANNG